MKGTITKILAATTISMALMPMANAGTMSGYGYITNVEPITEFVNRRSSYEDCQIREVKMEYGGYNTNRGSSLQTDQILGGILGGALGNQFGGGSGKDIMTAAGALLGASMATDSYNNGYGDSYQIEEREVCETKYRVIREKEVTHYLVEYTYGNVPPKSNLP